jgi:hypothetical protein
VHMQVECVVRESTRSRRGEACAKATTLAAAGGFVATGTDKGEVRHHAGVNGVGRAGHAGCAFAPCVQRSTALRTDLGTATFQHHSSKAQPRSACMQLSVYHLQRDGANRADVTPVHSGVVTSRQEVLNNLGLVAPESGTLLLRQYTNFGADVSIGSCWRACPVSLPCSYRCIHPVMGATTVAKR